MFSIIVIGIFFYKPTLTRTKEADLPLCPTNVLYFPQNLPMHCRMPTNADFPGMNGPIPTVPPLFQSPPSDKQPLPIPIQIPPGIPGPMPLPGPVPMPGPIPMQGPIPFPGPMPMPLPGPAHKLPVIVMPFYSPDPSFKKPERPSLTMRPHRPRKWRIRHKRRRPFYYSTDTSSSTDTDTSSDTSSSTSSEYRGWWKDRRNHRRFNRPNKSKKMKHVSDRQILTPVLQYVTKDGYVIFEKKITKNEAKDWLKVKTEGKTETSTQTSPEFEDLDSNEHNNRSREKEVVANENVEVLTRRNAHRLNRIKAYKNKVAKKHNVKQ